MCVLIKLTIILFLIFPSFCFAAPRIFYTDILSGPKTGGEDNKGCYLSIFGNGFGSSQGTSKVYINNIEVGAYKYWGSPVGGRPDIQQITVQPGSSVTTGPIKVVVNGVSSNTDHTFTVGSGDIYFVSLTGSDTLGEIGDITKPFRHLNCTYYRDDFGPGDHVVLRGGIYNTKGNCQSSFLDIRKSGTEANPIVVMGYPGEEVKYDRSAMYAFGLDCTGLTEDFSWNTVCGLIGIGDEDDKMKVGCGEQDTGYHWYDNFRYVNIKLVGGDCGNFGVFNVMNAHDLKVYGLTIDLIGLNCTNNQHHHFYFTHRAEDADVGWCYFLGGGNGGHCLQVRHTAMQEWHFNIAVHDSLFKDLPAAAMVWAKSIWTGNRIYNNIFSNTGLYSGSTQSGVILNDDNATAAFEIYNNTFYDIGQTGDRGLLVIESIGDITLRNNIFVVTSSGKPFYEYGSVAGTRISDHNLWYGSSQGPPTWDTNPITSSPVFVNPDLDFHLQITSPAIDVGATISSVTHDYDFNSRPSGVAYDIGVYEYVGDVTTTTTTATATGISITGVSIH